MCGTHNQCLINRQPVFTGQIPRVQISDMHFTAFKVYLGPNKIHPCIKVLCRCFCDSDGSLDARAVAKGQAN